MTKYLKSILLILLSLLFSCNNETKDSKDFNPAIPIEITDFYPKEGAVNTRFYIYGKNFGTDINAIKVIIGGEEAKVIGSDGECIYCIIPARAFDGSVKIIIGESEAISSEKFTYIQKTVVSTLCGNVTETGEYFVKDGSFEECGFGNDCNWISIDPVDNNILYVVGENTSIRKVNLDEKNVSTVITNGQMNINRARSLSWLPDGSAMIISNDQGSETGSSNVMLKRDDGFLRPQIITISNSCCGSDVHPQYSEVYFSKWNDGTVHKYDFESEEQKQLFKIWGQYYETNLHFHPSGDYAYLVIRNQNCIVKCKYNKDTRELENGNVFCGAWNTSGYNDAIGQQARFNRLEQGVFVKNSNYEKEGKPDIYDFYICDQQNHAIRKITPEGKVTTYAGRGSAGVNGDIWGYIDGDLRKEARFNQPTGIAYSEEAKTFFIFDKNNFRIRKIEVDDNNN